MTETTTSSYGVKIAENLCEADFAAMFRLERQYYSEEYITPQREALEWYRRFPYTVFAAKDEERIAGFVNMFPVREEVFDALRRGAFNDSGLRAEDIVDVRSNGTARLNMFLSCIAVARAYRGRGITKLLLSHAVEYYKPYSERCALIVADTVTDEGSAFAEKYGFEAVCTSDHASMIYIKPYSDFAEVVAGQAKRGRVREGACNAR